MRPRVLLPLALAASVWAGAPSTVAGQSLFATQGLGYPLEPRDARSQGMGGVNLGFPSPELTWANPASAINLLAPNFVIGYQHDRYDADAGGLTIEGRSARFPLLMGGAPAGERLGFFAGFGTLFEQNWLVENPDTLLIGADSVPIVDRATSTGGVGRFRLGGAYEIVEGVGVGFGVDLYTGSVERIQGRVFPPPFGSQPQSASWRYGGRGYTAGMHWSPGPEGAVGAAVTFGGTLRASGVEETVEDAEYDLPLGLQAGASGRVGANMLVALSGSWSRWSEDQEALGGFDTWSIHGGAEWDGLTVRDRPVPLRVGARTARLPFGWSPLAAAEAPSERALSLGAGLVMAGGAVRSDLSFDFGNRGGADAGLDESFVRFGLSVRVLGR
jgi:hypothetical protein